MSKVIYTVRQINLQHSINRCAQPHAEVCCLAAAAGAIRLNGLNDCLHQDFAFIRDFRHSNFLLLIEIECKHITCV